MLQVRPLKKKKMGSSPSLGFGWVRVPAHGFKSQSDCAVSVLPDCICQKKKKKKKFHEKKSAVLVVGICVRKPCNGSADD